MAKIRYNMRIDEDIYNKLKECSKLTGRTMISIVENSIDSYVKNIELTDKIQKELLANPTKVIELAKAMGLEMPKSIDDK